MSEPSWHATSATLSDGGSALSLRLLALADAWTAQLYRQSLKRAAEMALAELRPALGCGEFTKLRQAHAEAEAANLAYAEATGELSRLQQGQAGHEQIQEAFEAARAAKVRVDDTADVLRLAQARARERLQALAVKFADPNSEATKTAEAKIKKALKAATEAVAPALGELSVALKSAELLATASEMVSVLAFAGGLPLDEARALPINPLTGAPTSNLALAMPEPAGVP